MVFKKETFEVEFTNECIEEMTEIYDYIANQLKETNAAKRLLSEVMGKVLDLSFSPELYMKLGKNDKLRREYHRIVVKNYSVLYTIDFESRKVYVSRMIYGKRNYFNS